MDTSSIFNYVTILSSLFGVFYLYMKYKHSYWSRRGVYSPPSHWLFGHFKEFFFLQKSPPEIMDDLHNNTENKEPIIGFYILHKPFLLLRDPEAIRSVLVKDFNVFPNRSFVYNLKSNDLVTTKNLFSINQPEWKQTRVKMSPMFTTGKLKNLFGLMLETADALEKYLESKVKGKTNIEVKQMATKYTTDVIASQSFGIKIDSFQETVPEFYKKRK